VFRVDLVFLGFAHDLVIDTPIDLEIAAAPYCSERLFEFRTNDYQASIHFETERPPSAGTAV